MDKKQLSSKMYAFYLCHSTVLDNWGFYLFDQEFRSETELHNKIGSVWIISLVDVMKAWQRHAMDISSGVDRFKSSNPKLEEHWKNLNDLISSIGEILNIYSTSEYLAIWYLRNQLVHGFLESDFQDQVKVPIWTGEKIVTDVYEHSEFHACVRPYFVGNIDQQFEPLIGRLQDRRISYWHQVKPLIETNRLQGIRTELSPAPG